MTMENSKIEKDRFKEEFKKRIKEFVLNLIQFVDSLPHDRIEKVIGDQLIRSGTSVGANYFEARSASSKNDFINFFTYSLKSCNESKFWIELLIDSLKCNNREGHTLLKEANEISNIFASSILTLKGKK